MYVSALSNYRLTAYQSAGAEDNCTDAAKLWMYDAGVSLPTDDASRAFINTSVDYSQTLRQVGGANTSSGTAPTGHGPCN